MDASRSVFVDPGVEESVTKYLRCSQPPNAWFRTPPQFTVVRVNSFKTNSQSVQEKLTNYFEQTGQEHFSVVCMEGSTEVILVKPEKGFHAQVTAHEEEVIVDEMCGLAVLRGADVFAPGVLGLQPGLRAGTEVSVWADVEKKCLRGCSKTYLGDKVFVGNGILLLERDKIFKEGVKGVAVRLNQRKYNCPSLDDRIFKGELMLQNLPSVLAVDELDPQPGQRVLDMCAAPGGKTMHIASRMQDKGLVVALDKSKSKVNQIVRNCEMQGFSIVKTFAFDATKSIRLESSSTNTATSSQEEPPFDRQSFDRILLDAPCSALGQRPQFLNRLRTKELNSYSKLQRKLFRVAVDHLRPDGVLVYSTCTLAWEENQGMVDWALKTFNELVPVPLNNNSGGGESNWRVFGHPTEYDGDPLQDTIGFFIAKFKKRL